MTSEKLRRPATQNVTYYVTFSWCSPGEVPEECNVLRYILSGGGGGGR